MYVDENIRVDDKFDRWPKKLVAEIKERVCPVAHVSGDKGMDALYEQAEEGNDAWFEYLLREDVFESTIKQYCIDRKISERDLDLLFRRYGWR